MTRALGPQRYRVVLEPVGASPRLRTRERRVFPPVGTPGLSEAAALDALARLVNGREVPAGWEAGLATTRPVRRRPGRGTS